MFYFVFGILALIFLVLVVAFMFVRNLVFIILEQRHYKKYEEMGYPTIGKMGANGLNSVFESFFIKKEWRALSNDELTTYCELQLLIWRCGFVTVLSFFVSALCYEYGILS